MPDLRAAGVCGPYGVWGMIAISIKKLGPVVGPSFFGAVKF